jgi:hypothetical protein
MARRSPPLLQAPNDTLVIIRLPKATPTTGVDFILTRKRPTPHTVSRAKTASSTALQER